jgi:hypothetical protein
MIRRRKSRQRKNRSRKRRSLQIKKKKKKKKSTYERTIFSKLYQRPSAVVHICNSTYSEGGIWEGATLGKKLERPYLPATGGGRGKRIQANMSKCMTLSD